MTIYTSADRDDQYDRLVDDQHRAMQLMRSGDYTTAANVLTHMLEIDPQWDSGSAWFALGNCYEGLEEMPNALRCYGRAVDCDPLNVVFLGNYASCLYSNGDFAVALNEYLRLLQIETIAGNSDAECKFKAQILDSARRLGIPAERAQEMVNEAVRLGKGGALPGRE